LSNTKKLGDTVNTEVPSFSNLLTVKEEIITQRKDFATRIIPFSTKFFIFTRISLKIGQALYAYLA
jgi:hypothetical protein